MDTRLIPQGSEQWLKVKLGRFSASTISKIITKSGELTKDARKHVEHKVSQYRAGTAGSDYQSEEMKQGNEKEPKARIAYMKKTGILLKQTGFWCYGDWAGASPDGITFDLKGGGEFKSPQIKAFTQHQIIALENDIKRFEVDFKGYFWQCVMCMLVTDALWWDFCSYYNSKKTGELLAILRIERDESKINHLKKCLSSALEEHGRLFKLLGLTAQ